MKDGIPNWDELLKIVKPSAKPIFSGTSTEYG